MPSIKSTSLAVIGVISCFISHAKAGTEVSCPANAPVSCGSSSVSNTCCTPSPGGLLLQTQFWDTDPVVGPSNSWTIHGLWPDNCNGGYSENCDSKRAYKNITQILQSYGKTSLLSTMNTYWQSNDESNEDFWEHEWATHGTCVSTLAPACYTKYTPTQEVPDYFQQVVTLFQSLPTYKWLSSAGITPSSSKTYKFTDVQNAVEQQFGVQAQWTCSSGALSAVAYYYHVQGPVQGGKYIPTAPTSSSNCPATVSYLPKN